MGAGPQRVGLKTKRLRLAVEQTIDREDIYEALAIDANTIACEWDGTPMPYGTVIGQLVVVDGLT